MPATTYLYGYRTGEEALLTRPFGFFLNKIPKIRSQGATQGNKYGKVHFLNP